MKNLKQLATAALSILFFVQCSTAPVAQTKEGLQDGIHQIDARKYVLKNGMTLILSKNTKLPVFSIYTYYKVGSVHETPGMTGSSHFLEHMMFKGAKKYGKGQFDKAIEANGGSSNAYTSYDETAYYVNLPVSALGNILDLESDRMQNLLLDPSDFKKEKQVVLEERKMRYENSPNGQLYIGVMNKMFEKTPYEVPVIGTIEDIKGVSRDQVFEYFKDFYAPNNAVMLIVGDIDYEKTLREVKAQFEKIPASKDVTAIQKVREVGFENTLKKNIANYYHGKSENPLFALAFPGIKYGTREGYVGDLLAAILAGANSSYLNQKYVASNKPILSSISASNYTLKHSGIFFIMGEMIDKNKSKSFEKSLLKDFKNFCSTKITERNVQKVKNQYLLGFYKDLETNAGVARYLGTIESYIGDFTKYTDEIKTYQSIKTSEVKEACDKFLLSQNHYYMTVWKNNKKKFKI